LHLGSSTAAWHIFYHFFIDDDSLEVLLSQCLIHSSEDLTTWNTSSYGKYIRFCTKESMIETNPLSAFHLSPALSPTKLLLSIFPDYWNGRRWCYASTWCTSFYSQANAENPSLMIRTFVGDCMPFCQALHICRLDKVTKTGNFSRPWGLSQINFTEEYEGPSTSAPLLFNLMDTSTI